MRGAGRGVFRTRAFVYRQKIFRSVNNFPGWIVYLTEGRRGGDPAMDTQEELAGLYGRHFKMVYQLCLVLMKNEIGRASWRERV